MVRKDLRHNIHPLVVVRQDIIQFLVIQFLIGDKRREISFHTAVIFLISIPENIPGQPLHRSHIKLHLSHDIFS